MKRWIALGATVVVAVPAAVLLGLGFRFQPRAERENPAEVTREIARLTVARDSLRALVYQAASASDFLGQRPSGDIVIGLPTAFVEGVVRGVVTGWFHDVDLRLPQIRVRKRGEIKASMGILGRRTVGAYDLDVLLKDVHGRLQPDIPTLTFGGDTIHVSVPVRVAGGTGVARVTAAWRSKGLAGPVCGDLNATRDVTGHVRARTYIAHGQLVLSASGGTVFADPAFPDLTIRLFVDPAAESVAALDSLLTSKGGLCGYAIGKARASQRIQELVANGFPVKIPQRFFRPIQLPVALQTAVPVANRAVALTVIPSALTVTPSTIWIAAAVRPTGKAPAQRRIPTPSSTRTTTP